MKLVPDLAHLKVLHEEGHSRLTGRPERLVLVDHFGQKHDSFGVLFSLLTHPLLDDILDLFAKLNLFGCLPPQFDLMVQLFFFLALCRKLLFFILFRRGVFLSLILLEGVKNVIN